MFEKFYYSSVDCNSAYNVYSTAPSILTAIADTYITIISPHKSGTSEQIFF